MIKNDQKLEILGAVETSDLVKTHCKLSAIELLSDAMLSYCTHVFYTTGIENFLFGGYCQVDGVLRLPAELRGTWSKTAIFQFGEKLLMAMSVGS